MSNQLTYYAWMSNDFYPYVYDDVKLSIYEFDSEEKVVYPLGRDSERIDLRDLDEYCYRQFVVNIPVEIGLYVYGWSPDEYWVELFRTEFKDGNLCEIIFENIYHQINGDYSDSFYDVSASLDEDFADGYDDHMLSPLQNSWAQNYQTQYSRARNSQAQTQEQHLSQNVLDKINNEHDYVFAFAVDRCGTCNLAGILKK